MVRPKSPKQEQVADVQTIVKVGQSTDNLTTRRVEEEFINRFESGKWRQVRGGVVRWDWCQAEETGNHAMEGDG